MTTNENLVAVLNDLVQINNDRIEGYEKAGEEIKDIDVDLKAIFIKMAEDSIRYKTELINEISKFGGTADTGTSGLSKLHRVWMDVKAAFASKDRQAVLEACEFGEDAAQKAYTDALASDAEINADTRQLITTQQASLKTSHDIIKKYRDMHKAVNA